MRYAPLLRRALLPALAAALLAGGVPLAAQAVEGTIASAAPPYQPAYQVRGQVLAPTSAARGVVCPDALTNGTTAYRIPGVTPGRVFSLMADDATYRNDFDIRFFASAGDCAAGVSPLHHLNHAGHEQAVVPRGASVALVTLATGGPASFTYTELPPSPRRQKPGRKAVTVIAVIEDKGAYGIYHQDFLGSQHPWNLDGDQSNNIDFTKAPSTYIPGMPPEKAVPLHLARSASDSQSALRGADAGTLDGLRQYTEDEHNLYWFPGTKVVAAATFGAANSSAASMISGNSETHATGAASVAAGNFHGTCPECVFVLLTGDGSTAVTWASQQPWIDVVTNSWLSPGSDNGPTYGYADDTKAAVTSGQTVVWGAGNGLLNDFKNPPSFTWDSGQRGPDWVVTVGGVDGATDQTPRGAGKPADIASYVTTYPSAGGDRVDEEGAFAGTSNAAPVVAGTFAKVIQMGRDALGDETPGHEQGVLAEGEAVPCVLASAGFCPLDDGELTRAEVQQIVYDNVLPSMQDAAQDFADVNAPLLPPSEEAEPHFNAFLNTLPAGFTPAEQGNGIVYGRFDPDRFVAEQRRFSDALVGAVVPYPRPPGERAWLVVDSACRQQMWGKWDGGYYPPKTEEPADAVTAAIGAGCLALPPLWDLVPRS